MIKVIFTLFNLQGTALRQSLARWHIYLSTSTDLCQELFSMFFEEFSRFSFKPNSSIFSVFLSKLHQFLSLFVCRSLERLDILPHQSPFVNTFFQVFSRKFFKGYRGVSSTVFPPSQRATGRRGCRRLRLSIAFRIFGEAGDSWIAPTVRGIDVGPRRGAVVVLVWFRQLMKLDQRI